MPESDSFDSLLRTLEGSSKCTILQAAGVPQVGARSLPDDVIKFYQVCGGALLFPTSDYVTQILPPDGVAPIDALMWDGDDAPDDSSSSWFVIADDMSGNYVSIDLAESRLGWCYDTGIGSYGCRGDCPIIAFSFAEYLLRTLQTNGERYYWLAEGFVTYGDAYLGLHEPRLFLHH